MSTVRVRFAPSPTGFVHIGGLRTALYNYLFAKKHGGVFILRVEDTDRTRFVEGATENLIGVLKWAGLTPDEGPETGGSFGPYYQSQRTEIYRKYAQLLIDKGFAYYAFDSVEEIEEMRNREKRVGNAFPKYDARTRNSMRNSLVMSEKDVRTAIDAGTPSVVRLRLPENRRFEFEDIIRGVVSRESSEIDDQVLLKSDGFPTYHLANVVDDHLMEITHVIRGEEWLSSVPKHLYLYEALGWDPPTLAHLPLIFNPDGSKMSKRDIQTIEERPGKVDPDIETYIRRGYDRDALINYIALLGWNPGQGDERQVFSLKELVEEFSLDRVNKAAAIFDTVKLNWLNGEHLRMRKSSELAEAIKPVLQENDYSYPSDEYLSQVVELLKTRVQFTREIVEKGSYFFTDPTDYEIKTVKKRWKDDSAQLILEFCDEISKLEPFEAVGLESALRQIAERHESSAGRIIHPVRLAVSGLGGGPGLFEMLEVLGRETVVRRLKKGAKDIPGLRE